MKKDKWLKWKIGAVASVCVALLFNEIKTSAAFEQASAGAAATNEPAPAAVEQHRPHGQDGFRRGRFENGFGGSGRGSFGSGGGVESSPTDPSQPSQQFVPHTRTSRS